RRVVEVPEDAADEQNLEQRRHEVEEHEREQELDAAYAALDRSRQAAGLPLQVEAEREPVQMAEGREADEADRVLLDAREDRLAKLGEGLRADAGEAVAENERHRDDHDLRARERVHRLLVEDRHVDVDELRRDEEHDRGEDAQAQPRLPLRPEIRRKTDEAAQILARRSLRPARLAPAAALVHDRAAAGASRLSSRQARRTATARMSAPDQNGACRPKAPKSTPASAGPTIRAKLPAD